jgi:F0F1-type ATP synthase alpha subunit
MLGRVVDTLGNPIDGKGPITGNYTKCHWKEKLLELSTDNR